jgi:hypothetical protein
MEFVRAGLTQELRHKQAAPEDCQARPTAREYNSNATSNYGFDTS